MWLLPAKCEVTEDGQTPGNDDREVAPLERIVSTALDRMSPRLHGVRIESDGSGDLLFGFHRLLDAIAREPAAADAEVSQGTVMWPQAWRDGLFIKAHYKFHRLCWDSLHAAARLEAAVKSAEATLIRSPRGSLEVMQAVSLTTKDVTLYLDVLIFYFRMLADCFAMVLPALYGTEGQAIPKKSRDSFRKHRNWFDRNVRFDSQYAEILKEETGWFDALSGDSGWRDDLVHRFATWQIECAVGHPMPLDVTLIRGGWHPSPNLVDELLTAVAGFCRFLDVSTVHFARRINSAASSARFDLADEGQWGCHFDRSEGAGYWLLPRLPPSQQPRKKP